MARTSRIAIIGAALSANKGAAAMAETVIQRMPDHVGPCEFVLLTTYPTADEGRLPVSSNTRIVGLQPMRLALVEFPVATLAFLARMLRLPLGWVRARACRAMLDSDVVVDCAGISFSSGRGIPILVYNALMTGTPLLLGTPTVKVAQALGPFVGPVNRSLARLVLPHLATICARGARTREHLDSLGLSNVVDVADLAFSLEESVSLPASVARDVAAAGEGYVVVMPSSVVRGIVGSGGGDYVAAMAETIAEIRRLAGRGVVIAAHSYRVGMPEGRMNDGPVCREIAERLSGDDGVVLVDADLSAGELRHLVAGASVLVTSRFHAMISGLATCTPTVVVGWSHKYREVLDDFGLARFGMDSGALADPRRVAGEVASALREHDRITAAIAGALPAVKARSGRNFEVIATAMTRGNR